MDNLINQLGLIDLWNSLPNNSGIHILFRCAQNIYQDKPYLDNNKVFKSFKECHLTTMKLSEKYITKISGKLLNICNLNTHLNNPLAKESKRKLVLLTENESMAFYNLWDATKPLLVLTEKFIALNAYF